MQRITTNTRVHKGDDGAEEKMEVGFAMVVENDCAIFDLTEKSIDLGFQVLPRSDESGFVAFQGGDDGGN